MKEPSLTCYLKPGRLADVIALIQLLAFDPKGYPSAVRMRRRLGRAPLSASTWLEIAKDHPEFFRARTKEEDPDRKERAALIIRYVIGKIEDEKGEKARPPLQPAMASNLFEMAADLHAKQCAHRDRWHPWLFGSLGAGIAFAGQVIAAWIKA